jgi:hypothetical protein
LGRPRATQASGRKTEGNIRNHVLKEILCY